MGGTQEYDTEMNGLPDKTVEHLFWSCESVNSAVITVINDLADTVG